MAVEVYEWILSGAIAGEFVQTVQHVQIDSSPGNTPYQTAKAIAEAMVATDGLIETYLQCVPEGYQASSIRVRRVSTGGGPTAVILAADFNLSQGARVGAISSLQANPLIIWVPVAGTNITGRLFIQGVSEEDIDNMMLTGDLINNIQSFMDLYVSSNTSADGSFQGCIFNRTTHTGTLILAGRISPLIGTQRKRLHPV